MGKVLEQAKCRLFQKLRWEISDERVLQAMERVPRERFLPPESRHLAYEDIPLTIGRGQTISQPFIIAVMTSALGLRDFERVLEVGTGSGYQVAILSLMVPRGRVVTVERVPALAQRAQKILGLLGYDNVEVQGATPILGCPEEGPYDAIVVTAASPRLPQGLVDQLAPGGRLIIPIGTLEDQELVRVLKTGEGLSLSYLGLCRFVPLIGLEAWPNDRHWPLRSIDAL